MTLGGGLYGGGSLYGDDEDDDCDGESDDLLFNSLNNRPVVPRSCSENDMPEREPGLCKSSGLPNMFKSSSGSYSTGHSLKYRLRSIKYFSLFSFLIVDKM